MPRNAHCCRRCGEGGVKDPFYGTPETAVGPVWPHDPADEPLLKLRDELDRLRTENVRLQAMLRYLGYDPL